jgi:NADPH:quinone reductase-like Zn-dependent oxidoreductase
VISGTAVRDHARLERGGTVLINGASGGVGTFSVQIARSVGAEVTGVCSAKNVELAQALGADSVIDYTREDFTTGGRRYDVVFDCVGNRSMAALGRVLTPDGVCVMIGGGGNSLQVVDGLVASSLRSRFGSRKFVSFLASLNTADLDFLRGLIESRQVRPVIDRRYALEEVPRAIAYLEEGHARGKVAITIA